MKIGEEAAAHRQAAALHGCNLTYWYYSSFRRRAISRTTPKLQTSLVANLRAISNWGRVPTGVRPEEGNTR